MGISCSHQEEEKSAVPSVYIKSIQRSSNLRVPLTAKEVLLLRKSWPAVKQNWTKICLVAF